MRIALVHDYIIRQGGAERVLRELHLIFPEAPIYTIFEDSAVTKKYFPNATIRTSFLNRLPLFIKKRYKYLFPFLTLAVESFDLRKFDLVISSSSAFAKGIITNPDTIHIDYCHTPTRFLWDWTHTYIGTMSQSKFKRGIMRLILHMLRIWDFEAANRPDYIIANSKNVQKRIKSFYGRDSKVIYPPVHYKGVPGTPSRGYFLVVSYLQKYKNINIAVEAFTKLELPLIVIGEGPEKKYLESIAGDNITFLGWQSDESVSDYLNGCRAFIFPTDEDFGIAPIEAMTAGKPVLALRRGGALEYVEEGVTGEFFDDIHSVILCDGVRRMLENEHKYDSKIIAEKASSFGKERFSEEIRSYVYAIMEKE